MVLRELEKGFQTKKTACKRHRGRKELIRLLLKRMKKGGMEER